MLQKNDIVSMTITGMGSDGEGVGRVEGMAVFVPLALPQEQVTVRIVKVLKNYAFGKVESIDVPSPRRMQPDCGYFPSCGGCSLWHMDAQGEQDYKTQLVKDCLVRIGGIDCEVADCLMPEGLTNYRNKAQFPVTHEGIGLYASRSHRLVPLTHCRIQHPCVKDLLQAVEGWRAAYQVEGYNEATHSGTLRGVYIRVGVGTGEIMVCLITRTGKLPHARQLIDSLLQVNQNIVSIVQSVNGDKTNVLMGKEVTTLYGKDTIVDRLCGLTFQISPHSFYQVNHRQTEVLYQKVMEFAGLTGVERVFDLYCGIGTIGLCLAHKAKEVIGVECVPQAIANARENAAQNGIANASFSVGQAEELVPALGRADVVIVDPPRKGCDDKLLQTIGTMAPSKIVYVSCNPATLARDVKTLQSFGYQVEKAQPVNLFPRTSHVETVVLMSRK